MAHHGQYKEHNMATSIFGDNTQVSTLKVEGANVTAHGKNYIMNGGFDYWNYATTQITSGYGSDDRWTNLHSGSTKTHSLVNATDTERALFNSSKFSRTIVTSVAGVGNFVSKQQYIENVTKLGGKTVTLSFWAKADSNKNIGFKMSQVFGTGGTPSASIDFAGQLIGLTSIWQKKSITIIIPSIVGKTLGTDGAHTSHTDIKFGFDIGSTLSSGYGEAIQQSGTFDIAEVKLEVGSVATPWSPYEGEFGGEVQACQRYLPSAIVSGYLYSGQCFSATSGFVIIPFTVSSRVPPTGMTYTGTLTCTLANGTVHGSGVSFMLASLTAARVSAVGATALVSGNATTLYSAGSVILFTGCEL